MFISRTPFRVSFFGGGTDYPDWYRKHGGAVLSMAIDKYCYISARYLPQFFGIRHRVVWSHIETVDSISEILHPAVRAGLKSLGFDDKKGLEIHHQGDLPARTGIGSSSAFAVGLIKALHAVRGTTIEAGDLAQMAIDLEQNKLHETVGCQDQVASAYGGLNVIRFHSHGEISVDPLDLPPETLSAFEERLMVFYIGSSRLSSTLAKQLVTNLDAQQKNLQNMMAMVPEAVDMLRSGAFDAFGELLHKTWMVKRALTDSISTPIVDQIYDEARKAGALGGKLLGAGGTGFMVFVVPPERQAGVSRALSHLVRVPVGVDFSGSTIIYRQDD